MRFYNQARKHNAGIASWTHDHHEPPQRHEFVAAVPE